MVQKALGNTGKHLNEEWHVVREQARRSLGSFEWGPIETTRYDLDNIKFDRTMREVFTDPQIDTEAGPTFGIALSGPYNRTDVESVHRG